MIHGDQTQALVHESVNYRGLGTRYALNIVCETRIMWGFWKSKQYRQIAGIEIHNIAVRS